MKRLLLIPFLALLVLFTVPAVAQTDYQQPDDQLNLPGDNLNLYAVMKLFQESPTLEEFEKKLNDESLKVNNLDLDGDNNIDYIKVVDNVDGDTHNIALRVAVSKDEDQDVAVMMVQKDNNGQVHIQLIGDEDLYGKDYIIEPDSAPPTSTPNPGYTGVPPQTDVPDQAVYQIATWPVVQFIYVPTYRVWRSPWRWGYYPSYWHPWTPFFWHEYYGYQYHWNYYYRAHYRYTPVYRNPSWRDRYYGGGYRSRAPVVQVRISNGGYRQTYSRPDYANRGSDLFRRDHPNAPSVNRRLPRFDASNNNRPIVNRRNNNYNNNNGFNNRRTDGQNNNGGNRPGGNNRPYNGNNDRNNNRPVTSPGNNRPADGNTNNNPGRPSRPVNANPADGNNNTNRPVTRPVTTTPNPANSNNNPTRPATRPAVINPSPANGNNNTNRPARPVNAIPSNRNTERPVTRPARDNNFPARPATTQPVQPRQQPQRQQPVNRPAGNGPSRPAGENRGNR